ncbi:dUTP diphosphatase [Leucobacter sp. cx-169]|nr:dUTP diphosphatase [Leucobacter sp. cx-169]MBC9927217.1 dUTP diphosphatase [Leucobacter sp. cx-169]
MRLRSAGPGAAEPLELPVTGTLPSRANPGDAGLDLRMDHELEAVTIAPGERMMVSTGTSLELPEGVAGLVCPRSGLALKHGVTVLNAPGVVDAGYRGVVGVILINHGAEPFVINPGDRIAQLVLTPFVSPTLVHAETLSASTRGGRGFGSTGVS